MKDMSIFTIALPANLDNYKALYKFLIAVSVIALLGAYATEYIMKLPPCVLCWYQRYCYFLLIIFSAACLLVKVKSKWMIGSIAIILFSACAIAGYHSGIERGIVKASKFCSSHIDIADNLSVSEIKDMLYDRPVASCERAALKFAGLSMAEWNLLLNIGLLLVLFNVSNFRGKNYAKA